ncbi:MAG: NAD-dependent epimerase/dehydratase family protein, partial [bacterium]
ANLVRRLLGDGHEVRVLLRTESSAAAMEALQVERVFGDLRDLDATRAAVCGCRRVYHCAAKVSTIDGEARHQREIYDCNVVATQHLLRAAREAGVTRVVVTGSFSAVGYKPDQPSAPSDEAMPFYPFERSMPYERSKVLVEHECLKAAIEGLDVVIATSCAIVGGNDFLPSRLGRTVCDCANGKLRAYIRGGFEFVAVRDIVEGHLLCMEKGRTGHKYIFSTEFLMLDDLLDLVEEASGVVSPRRRLPAPVMLAASEVTSFFLSRLYPTFPQRLTPGAIRLLRKCRRADLTKARTELGYRPTSIREAVQEAYAFHYARGAITHPAARQPSVRGPSEDTAPPVSMACPQR